MIAHLGILKRDPACLSFVKFLIWGAFFLIGNVGFWYIEWVQVGMWEGMTGSTRTNAALPVFYKSVFPPLSEDGIRYVPMFASRCSNSYGTNS